VDLWVNKFIARVIKGGVLVVGGWVLWAGQRINHQSSCSSTRSFEEPKGKPPLCVNFSRPPKTENRFADIFVIIFWNCAIPAMCPHYYFMPHNVALLCIPFPHTKSARRKKFLFIMFPFFFSVFFFLPGLAS